MAQILLATWTLTVIINNISYPPNLNLSYCTVRVILQLKVFISLPCASSLPFKCPDFFLEGSRESLLDVYVVTCMVALGLFRKQG